MHPLSIKPILFYELSSEKMQRYEELFFQPDYTVTELPSYQPETASNRFRHSSIFPIFHVIDSCSMTPNILFQVLLKVLCAGASRVERDTG